MSTNNRVQLLLDKDEIRDRIYSFCRGVDRRDWNLVRSAYHADGIDDHGPYNGDVDGMIAWMTERHATVKSSMHHIGNVLVEVDGDVAYAESYYLAYQRIDGSSSLSFAMFPGTEHDGSDVNMRAQGRYIDRFERRSAGGPWKIAHRTVVADAAQFEPTTHDMPIDVGWNSARRDRTDAVYNR
ncbi:nuclear transport factor 2 family protein [Agrococcus baldri]|uniref:SnoaL-like domain-containing protein n=1 Tax=Agrococcus baldri TaxID=153730 RepID=A0AA87RAT7_9MICO|nr:nuclear transport factor 2 family protein [Agrococcus baldri]GEK79640.1 hypothetical protein ABA31_09910 [Agrococcus baldri]